MSARLLLIDNYDSFTYNLVQAFLVLGAEVSVYRNDALEVPAALALAPSHLCISPGPGTPRDAGISMDMIRAFAGRIPVLGVCLGHQSIVEVFGGQVVRAERLMHGKTSLAGHDGRTLFVGLPQPCEVGRYHSLIAAPATLPPVLEVSATHRAGGDHGGAPPHAHRRGRAVPPREHPHARGPAAARQFPAIHRRRPRARGWSGRCSRVSCCEQLLERRDLSADQAEDLLAHLTDAKLPPAMGGALLAALPPRAWRRRSCADLRRRCAAGRAVRSCRPVCAPSTSSARAAMLPGASTSRPARRCSPPPAACRS